MQLANKVQDPPNKGVGEGDINNMRIFNRLKLIFKLNRFLNILLIILIKYYKKKKFLKKKINFFFFFFFFFFSGFLPLEN